MTVIIKDLPTKLRNLISFHYRRSKIGEVEEDTKEFRVILEKDGKKVKVGRFYTEGTFHLPREIFELIREKGWGFVAVQSCYKWTWTARRYINAYEAHTHTQQDVYGRYYVEDLWCGWYDIIDFEGTRYKAKYFHNSETGQEKTVGGIPKSIQKMFDETEWMKENHEERGP